MKKFIPVCAIAILPAFLVQTTDSNSTAQKAMQSMIATKSKVKSESPKVLRNYVDTLVLYRKYLDSMKKTNVVKIKELKDVNKELKNQDSLLEVLTVKSKENDLY